MLSWLNLGPDLRTDQGREDGEVVIALYAAIKKNTFESVLMRWMKLEPSKPERKTPIQYTNVYIWNLERW